MKKDAGITLIALVVTIIVLLILAGVTISLVVGENGIITKAREAKERTEQAAKEEQQGLAGLDSQINDLLEGNTFNETKKVNVPKLVDGMTPIKFTEPTDSTMGSVTTTSTTDTDWYDYSASKWANTQTQDGSMWVWIPRYAYKITYNNPSDKSQGGSIDVKFLIGTSDEYYDDNGNRRTAQRARTIDQDIDTTADYTVHPAFTNESSIGFRNGGWDKELTGIWVAKFEAGFASGNNSTQVARSNVKYTQTTVWVTAVEAGTASDSSQAARNWLDGIYGENLPNISYPVFQPKTYSMNYINVNDAYDISRTLTDNGNIYGFSNTADSHLMKNSEWGACSYLSHSKYGTNGQEIAINNANLNSGNTKRETSTAGGTGVVSAYAITGCTDGSTSNVSKVVNIGEINSVTGNTPTVTGEMYVWNQKTGVKASSTMNMTGVYDMSGGAWEREASYVANGNNNLKTYGASLAYNGDALKTTSTKYTTVYPHDSNVDINGANVDDASKANYAKNTKIYGDGIRETSVAENGFTSWNGDCSYFPRLGNPFFLSSGVYWDAAGAGLFYFNRTGGNSICADGFRAVVVPQ